MKNLQVVEEMMAKDTDISSHLTTLYKRVLQQQPKLIVELGVRGGESSKVFALINEEIGSRSIGVDLDKCDYSFVPNGHFIQADDIKFAKKFSALKQEIDVLFIDTSHLYEHTRQEISSWFPFLSDHALVIFHDTNLKSEYTRHNGTKGTAWDNERGVIRAVEEYFGSWKFDETTSFKLELWKDHIKWIMTHDPICNGLLILDKNPEAA